MAKVAATVKMPKVPKAPKIPNPTKTPALKFPSPKIAANKPQPTSKGLASYFGASY